MAVPAKLPVCNTAGFLSGTFDQLEYVQFIRNTGVVIQIKSVVSALL